MEEELYGGTDGRGILVAERWTGTGLSRATKMQPASLFTSRPVTRLNKLAVFSIDTSQHCGGVCLVSESLAVPRQDGTTANCANTIWGG